MTSILVGIALKIGELILDKIISNKAAKARAARWLENLQSYHVQTSVRLTRRYEALVKKYRTEVEQAEK